jgi:nucleoside-diphosphate-sugar epimerase
MILLTGANGFLGRYIFGELIKTENVLTLGRKNTSIICDLTKNQFYINKNIEIVIHCAGLAHVDIHDDSMEDSFYTTNVVGTKNLLLSLEKSKHLPRYFLYISSVSVYGLNKGENIDESNPLLSNDSYGRSKIDAEIIVNEWCIKNNIICTILRLPLIVGENPPGNLNFMINGIKRGYYFNIAGGRSQKSMVLASDVAQCILKVSKIGGIFNLTDGYHPTFNELSSAISFQIGRKNVPNMPLLFAKILAKIGDLIGESFPLNSNKLSKIMATLTFDDTKARKVFGWNPCQVLEGFKISGLNL